MKTILKCGLLFDATSEDCLKRDMAVVVEGERIAEVVPVSAVSCDGVHVIDLSGKFVMPGLIDAHLHLQFNKDPGGRNVVYGLSIGEIAIKSLATANIDLMAGFTTMRVMSAQGNSDVAVRNSIARGWAKGPRLYCSGEPLGSLGGNGDTSFREDIKGGALGHMVNGPIEARYAAREVFKRGCGQIKLSAAGAFLDFGDLTGAPEMTRDEMAAVEIAHMQHKIAAAHTYDAQSIRNAVEAGADTIEHCIWVDDETLELMAQKGTWMVPTHLVLYQMRANADKFGITGKNLENLDNAILHQRRQVMKAREMGIGIAFGSDAGTPFNVHGLQAQELVLLNEIGLRPAEVLILATRGNAEMLRWDDRIGAIEAGKFADIVAFDANPLDNINAIKDCSFVMKGGEVFKG